MRHLPNLNCSLASTEVAFKMGWLLALSLSGVNMMVTGQTAISTPVVPSSMAVALLSLSLFLGGGVALVGMAVQRKHFWLGLLIERSGLTPLVSSSLLYGILTAYSYNGLVRSMIVGFFGLACLNRILAINHVSRVLMALDTG